MLTDLIRYKGHHVKYIQIYEQKKKREYANPRINVEHWWGKAHTTKTTE